MSQASLIGDHMIINNSGAKLVRAIHFYQYWRDRRGVLAPLFRAWSKLRLELWSVITGADIHRDARVDPSLRLPHPNGVVIHREAVVEQNCLIMQQVTIGQVATPGAPRIKEGAYLGSGAKILGEITIGRNARVGANAVVMVDVPDNCTAVGVPARIVQGQPGSRRSIEQA